MLLGNLFRDQLDRFGELETIADRWAALVARLTDAGLALNADDPLIADLGRDRAGGHLLRRRGSLDGLSRDAARLGFQALPPVRRRVQLRGDLPRAPRALQLPSCGQRRPQPAVAAERIELNGTRSARFALRTPTGSATVSLPLPGLYNVYNALGAAALCLELGIPLRADRRRSARRSAPRSAAPSGSSSKGVELSILLVKNPAGANEILRTLVLEPGEHELVAILNDRTADGRDISWIWDADFELLAQRVRRITCSGTRAAELALRLKYAGVPVERLHVIPELSPALDDALRRARDGRIYALPTYTALLELRDELARRGLVNQFWAADAGARP